MSDAVFPPAFLERIANVYGKRSDIHRMASDGNRFAGRLMDDASQGGLDAKLVAEMIADGEAERLREVAEGKLAKRAIYQEFLYRYRRERFPEDSSQWGSLPEGVAE
jgi:hypothetical protein